MTTIWNDPASFKDDMIDGFLAAYGRYVERVPGTSGVMRRGGAREGKVSVVVGGGSGHYPAFCGVVGPGLADGAVIGDIFTSPSTEQAYRVGKALDGGAGVLFTYGNYAGDVLNFGAAEERLRAEGVDCRTVLVTDDIASGSPDEVRKRRGVAGDLPVFKVASALADRGASLDDVERIALKANDMTRSFGVAFAGCTLPGESAPLFTVDEGKMELGLGIHGEPGVRSAARAPAAELARSLVDALLEERPSGVSGRAGVMLNGLGATKYEELFVLYKDVAAALGDAGVEIVLPEVGELVTSLDMAGCSLTLFWLDEELEDLWAAPADTPAFKRGSVTEPAGAGARVDAAAKLAAAEEEAGAASAESREAAQRVRAALDAILRVLEEREAELGRLDSVAGDGDHGAGMVRGARAAVEAAAGDGAAGAGSVLRRAGQAWGDRAGGTSGALWGAMLERLGAALGDHDRPTAQAVADGVREAAATVQKIGQANLGDKTLLDALLPFTDALSQRVAAGESLADAWNGAAPLADDAAGKTADMTAKVGRARPLGDRSLGTPDPGAVSMALCLAAVGETLR